MTDFTQIDGALDAWIDTHRDEIVRKAQGLLRIPSVGGDAAPGAPFGVETRRALDYVVDLCARWGLATKSVDGYAMHADFGSGDGLIGVLSHVDVVPAGSDWVHEPFGAVVEDGKIFARGAIDDKGPCIASLYAMFAVKECGIPVVNRVRAIIGADEESGFKCVEHYFAHEEMPDIGFTPDGSFPVIFAEKGIAVPEIDASIPATADAVKLVSLTAGQRSNMVPDRATAILTCNGDIDLSEIGGGPIGVERGGDTITLSAIGVSAHASLPHEGVNAVGLVCDALIESGLMPGAISWLTAIRDYAADNSGAPLGIAGHDDVSGPLTCSLGVARTESGMLRMTFSVRYPVTWSGDDVRARIDAAAGKAGFHLAAWHDSPPLYVPADDPLVATFLDVYRRQTGDMRPPKTMGGGTYARALKKGVAFGPNFPGFPDIAHKADEFWYIDELILATKIYAKAIARLASESVVS